MKDLAVLNVAATSETVVMDTARQMRVTSQRKAVRISAAAHSWDGESVPLNKIVTPRSQHKKRSRRTLFIKTKTQSANLRGNPLYDATKRHLNNS